MTYCLLCLSTILYWVLCVVSIKPNPQLIETQKRRGISISPDALDTSDKQSILDLHNNLRDEVASGTFFSTLRGSNLPSATNMNQLLWDPALAASAATVASTCNFAHTGMTTDDLVETPSFELPTNAVSLGENLAASGSSNPTPPTLSDILDLMQLWIDEGILYDYGRYPDITPNDTLDHQCTADPSCGHFTQMIWSDTRYIGCGFSYCGTTSLETYVVCQYYRPGNVRTQYPYDMGTACADCDTDRDALCDGDSLCGGGVDSSFNNDGSTDIDDCDNGLDVVISTACTPSDTTTANPTTFSPTTATLTTATPTTVEPTTAMPTTAAPTTDAPTTNAQTTNAPITNAPITNDPTTNDPTTNDPTTNDPTTNDPTTNDPTTNDPTTNDPTTNDPTTNDPTTNAPTTNAPTTVSPTTAAPTTSSPTTADTTNYDATTTAPTTAEPTTIAPTTSMPTTATPTITDIPTTASPTTAVPTTLSPTTDQPTTDDPTTAAPTTDSPTTNAPFTTESTTDDLTTTEQTVETSTTLDPTTTDNLPEECEDRCDAFSVSVDDYTVDEDQLCITYSVSRLFANGMCKRPIKYLVLGLCEDDVINGTCSDNDLNGLIQSFQVINQNRRNLGSGYSDDGYRNCWGSRSSAFTGIRVNIDVYAEIMFEICLTNVFVDDLEFSSTVKFKRGKYVFECDESFLDGLPCLNYTKFVSGGYESSGYNDRYDGGTKHKTLGDSARMVQGEEEVNKTSWEVLSELDPYIRWSLLSIFLVFAILIIIAAYMCICRKRQRRTNDMNKRVVNVTNVDDAENGCNIVMDDDEGIGTYEQEYYEDINDELATEMAQVINCD